MASGGPISTSITTEQLALQALRLAATQRITMEALADTVSADTMLDHASMTLALRLEAYVHELVNDEKTYELVERPVPETWRDHLIMSLPEGSFRRRWLQNFWDREDGPRVITRSHEVRVRRATAFPDGHFPKSFGRPQPYTMIEPSERYYE